MASLYPVSSKAERKAICDGQHWLSAWQGVASPRRQTSQVRLWVRSSWLRFMEVEGPWMWAALSCPMDWSPSWIKGRKQMKHQLLGCRCNGPAASSSCRHAFHTMMHRPLGLGAGVNLSLSRFCRVCVTAKRKGTEVPSGFKAMRFYADRRKVIPLVRPHVLAFCPSFLSFVPCGSWCFLLLCAISGN